MGIRPNKIIGWSVNIQYKDLKNGYPDFYNMLYSDFVDYCKENNYLTQYFNSSYFTNENEYYRDRKLSDVIDIVSFDYDSEPTEDSIYSIVISPMVSSSLFLDDARSEFYSGDSAFVYAELEHLFPEAFDDLKTNYYNIKDPIFPSSYTIMSKEDYDNNKYHFLHYKDLNANVNDIKHILMEDGNLTDTYCDIYGYDNKEEVRNKFLLCPPADVVILSKFLDLFVDDSYHVRYLPQVTYYWT